MESSKLIKPNVKIRVIKDYGTSWIYGRVYGHPRFTDGQDVTTSHILNKNDKGFETLNTVYEIIDEVEEKALCEGRVPQQGGGDIL